MREKVVVTGAGDSVGRAIAESFLKQGDSVHICDIRPEAIEETLAANPGMTGSVTNVGDAAAVKSLFEDATAAQGPATVLANVVGVAGPNAPTEEVSDEDWQNTMAANVDGMFYCVREVIPEMKGNRHGVIVNFSTASTRTCLPFRSPYVVSKYAVEGLTRNLARELGPYNVRCNAILPGGINNDRLVRVLTRSAERQGKSFEELLDEALRYVSMRSLVEPQELADMALYLASESAAHVSGQLIAVDGNQEWEE